MKRPIRTASPTLRQIFQIADEQGLDGLSCAKSMGIHPNQLAAYRAGRNAPGILTVEEMANSLGYRLSLVPIDDERTER